MNCRYDNAMGKQQRALIIGGSLGGLFAANLLRSIGWHVEVFERVADDLATRGAGIGTHDELIALNGHYALLAATWNKTQPH